MRRAIPLILAVTVFTVLFSAAASAEPKGPGSFTIHLECEGGEEFDILVPVGASFAALVEGSNSVAVLKGVDVNFDGTSEFLRPGFSVDNLTACTAFLGGQRLFVGYTLFTPRGK